MKHIIRSIGEYREKRPVEAVLLVLFVVLVAATTFTVDPYGIKQAVLDVLNKAS